jgi:hypothetical protein
MGAVVWVLWYVLNEAPAVYLCLLMPKLTRHTSFSDLKSEAERSKRPVDQQAHSAFEALINRLRAALANQKADKGHAKQFGGGHS